MCKFVVMLLFVSSAVYAATSVVPQRLSVSESVNNGFATHVVSISASDFTATGTNVTETFSFNVAENTSIAFVWGYVSRPFVRVAGTESVVIRCGYTEGSTDNDFYMPFVLLNSYLVGGSVSENPAGRTYSAAGTMEFSFDPGSNNSLQAFTAGQFDFYFVMINN